MTTRPAAVARLDAILEAALAEPVASAISLRVAVGEQLLYARDAGLTAYDVQPGDFPGDSSGDSSRDSSGDSIGDATASPAASPASVGAGTRYDLASLTKPLCTVTLIAQELTAARLDLNAALPTRHPGPPGVTLEQLLAHTSGLPAWNPYYAPYVPGHPTTPPPEARAAIRDIVAATAAEAAPGARTLYSDLGFMLLGWALEDLHGQPLSALFDQRVAAPLGLGSRLGFRPARAGTTHLLAGFAATERCPWRGRLLVGEVHDDNAWVQGGACGHAGLFGDADAVMTLARVIADFERCRTLQIDPAVLRRLTARSPSAASTRAPGWDLPSEQGYTAAGKRLSREAFGHTGYTGTSLWIERSSGLIVTLLTNRVHPSRQNTEGIRKLRPAVHDAAHALAADVTGATPPTG